MEWEKEGQEKEMPQAEAGLKQDEVFLRRAFHASLLPCMLSILSSNLNILADGILVGQRIGTDGLSAISLCVPVYLILCVIGSFLVSGTAIPAAQAIGQQQMDRAQRMYSTAFWSCLAASLVITVAGVALCRPLTAVLCRDEAIRPLVMEYTVITLIGALPKILIYVPFWFLRMDGRAKVVAWMMFIMGAGNVALDLLFLYPLGLGVSGAAWASVIATAAACVLGLFFLSSPHSSFHLSRKWTTDPKEWREISSAGSPSALNNLFQTLRLLAVNSLLMQAGGSILVAAFAAVNCISAFSLCIVDGVPQAASAMLAIYSGERDNDSAVLLIRREWKTGVWCCVVFSAAVILGADLIAALYGLPVSLRFAMICLSAGLFPALWCSILSTYYNISDHVRWANLIICCRVFLAAAASLYLTTVLGGSPWWFLVTAELVTLILWYGAMAVWHRRNPDNSRYLMMDRSLEREGRVLNFSVSASAEEICEASGKISEFCEENQMNPRQIMRFSLAIEEIMTMIMQVNGENLVSFDVRVFSVHHVMGIRIRYDGVEFNPFAAADGAEDDEQFLGVRMIAGMMESTMYLRTFGVNTVQLLL